MPNYLTALVSYSVIINRNCKCYFADIYYCLHNRACVGEAHGNYRWFIFDWGAIFGAGRLYWGVKKVRPNKKRLDDKMSE